MIPWFQYTVVHIGPIPIQVWGFFVALGMLVSLSIIHRLAKKRGFSADLLGEGALSMIVAGLIGARLAHVVLYEPLYYMSHPLDMIKIWEGGMSSFGGLVGALVAFAWFVKKKLPEHYSLPRIGDVYAYAALFGWLIGRIGCVMIHDHPGQPCSGALCMPFPDGVARYDMALLEMLGLLPLLVTFLIVRKKKQEDGLYAGILFAYYGVLRFFLDFLRATDIAGADVRYLGLTPGQYFAIVTAGIGFSIIKQTRYGKKKRV